MDISKSVPVVNDNPRDRESGGRTRYRKLPRQIAWPHQMVTHRLAGWLVILIELGRKGLEVSGGGGSE